MRGDVGEKGEMERGGEVMHVKMGFVCSMLILLADPDD